MQFQWQTKKASVQTKCSSQQVMNLKAIAAQPYPRQKSKSRSTMTFNLQIFPAITRRPKQRTLRPLSTTLRSPPQSHLLRKKQNKLRRSKSCHQLPRWRPTQQLAFACTGHLRICHASKLHCNKSRRLSNFWRASARLTRSRYSRMQATFYLRKFVRRSLLLQRANQP